jgi:hypothetical protein
MAAPPPSYDAIVLGAGAAGLMCAATAGQRGARVLLLDHNQEVGAKILISGGGRCNFTNLDVRPDRFISANPHFCKSALARYTQHDFVALVRRHRIPFYEKTLGQLFCEGQGSARAIVAMLLDECRAGGVELRTNVAVRGVEKSDRFVVATSVGSFEAASLVVATGGLSIPKLGASGFAYDLALRFGLALSPVRPGLVPLTFDAQTRAHMAPLSGISLEARVSVGDVGFREGLLFTHRGLSGPSILQISSYWRPGESLTIDLAPDGDGGARLVSLKRERPKLETHNALAQLIPARFAAVFEAGLPAGVPLGDVRDDELREAGAKLRAWRVTPAGDEGYAKAEVTLGGIDTAALSQKTMEARAVPGLHIIGEAVDVTGWLGGYNFQWAWSSGWAAGVAIAERKA